MRKISTVLFAVFFFVCQAHAQVSEAEREALIDLYHATGGDAWRLSERWLGEPGTECTWRGVFCASPEGSVPVVRMLGLPLNGLSGVLPESIGNLVHLEILSLFGNDLQGAIPPSLGNLGKLTQLHLDGNRLSGLIPGELLHLTGSIWLSDNLLAGFGETGITAEGGEKSIGLDNNRITSLPPESWFQGSGITWLGLSNNEIAGVVSVTGQPWPGLTGLDLSGNAITELSGLDAGVLVDIEQLDMASNALEHWPIEPGAMPGLRTLRLENNALAGAVPDTFRQFEELSELVLEGNEITGGVETLLDMPGLRWLNLSGNPLGALPELIAAVSAPLTRFDISNADLEGEVPDWFADLALVHLDLSDNSLVGEIDNAVAAMNENQEHNMVMDLSGNDFDGSIPEAILGMGFRSHGVDLCWNRFDEPIDASLLEGIPQAGGSLELCNNRVRRDVGIDISGTWYAPELSGQGYSVMLLEDDSLIAYWWGYPEYYAPGEQMWLFNMVAPTGPSARVESFVWPWPGDFGKGQSERGRVAEIQSGAEFRFDALADGKLHAYSSIPNFWVYVQSSSIMSPALAGSSQSGKDVSPQLTPVSPPVRDRRDLSRLTRLAGTGCDNQHPGQEMSGLWYDPQRSGEGFVVEVIGESRALAYWFTYTPDAAGNQAWMIGDGSFDGATLHIDNLVQPVGGGFGPHFDPADVDRVHWGTLTLEFFDGSSGHIYWDSVFEEYGAGDYPIRRLARAKLAECELD